MAIRSNPLLTNSTFLWNLVFALTMLVYAVGLVVPIMEPDAAVYAQVSMEMHDRGDYFSIYHKGVDWLDKPHFPFWMSAFSYEVFGVNTFAYKLPAVIFVLIGAFYTYLFGKKFYSPLHGWIAVIILITAEHIIISNQDVRAEPFMTGLMIMGLYHLASLVKFGKKADENSSGITGTTVLHSVLGALACACLIMTKGLFTIIPVASGIGLALVYARQWREIFHVKWLAVIVLTGIFLSPAVYGYYQQFDQHPEKTVFGQTGVSGVEFFLWTSQWGRFTNTGPIKGKGDLTFFIHTLLWAFLPWAFAAFFALFRKTKELVRGLSSGENFTFFGFITLFLIFSASRFQLSFYLNPIFPLLALITTAELLKMNRRTLKTFSIIHFVLSVLLAIGLIGLHWIFSGSIPRIDTIVIVIAGMLVGFYVFAGSASYLKKIVFATALIVVSVNYYLNRQFYPELLGYQAESVAARFIKANNIPPGQVVFVDEMQSIADVILHQPTKVVAIDSVAVEDVADKYVFTPAEGRAKIDSLGLKYEIIEEFLDFPVTRLTGKFINRSTRLDEVKTKYFLKVEEYRSGTPEVEITLLNDEESKNIKQKGERNQYLSLVWQDFR